jgi:hypothetical protein
MDLKTHCLRRPSQEKHGVQPSRANTRSQARSLAQEISKKNEFSTAPVRA